MRSTALVLGLSVLTCALACSDERSAAPLPKSADSGFQLEKHAFAFENFAVGYDGSAMNGDLAARMFGKDNVCKSGLAYCEPTADATAWIESANVAMNAGRCEGFAVLSQLFFLGHLDPKEFGADTTRALALDENYALQKEVAYWFATQLVPGAIENKALMPRDAIAFMAEFMKEGSEEFYRIGMVERLPTGFGDAHSLTPIGFDRGEASNVYYVRVYDNNFPAVERRLRLDVDANTWEYEGVNEGGTMMFTGGEKTRNPLYFAPTVARDGLLECPFCKGMQKRTLIAHGASPLLKDAAGNMVGIQGGEIIEGEGGSVTPGFSMCINGTAPVVVSSNTPPDMPIEVTLDPNGSTHQQVSIRGGSLGTVSVEGDLTSKEAAQLQVSGNSVSIQSKGGSTTVRMMDGNTFIDVTVSGAAGDVKVSRDANGKLKVETDDAKGATVQVTLTKGGRDASGAPPPSTSYTFTATEGESSATVNVPNGGWDGKTPPAATVTTDGMETTLIENHCVNRLKDRDESDTDCGGARCAGCDYWQKCSNGSDCKSGSCGALTRPGYCANLWEDGKKSGDETDVDCGGTTSTYQRCTRGKACKLSSDCFQALGTVSIYRPTYAQNPATFCKNSVCTASAYMTGRVLGDYPNLQVRLTPDGKSGDASIQRIESPVMVRPRRSPAFGDFEFAQTMVTGDYRFEVVRQPSADTACWFTQHESGNIGDQLYFGPEYLGGTDYDLSRIFIVKCDKVETLCSNATKDLHESGVDCGGTECNGIGKYCAVGGGCASDADCGNPQLNTLCASMVCKKTYDVRGSVYTTVPVTIQLTPGGNLGGASDSPRTFSARPTNTSFVFEGTRVSGAYTVTATAPTGGTCSVTGGTGDATGVTESYVETASVKCTSCGNGTKEGKETDVDCGGDDCVAQNKLCATDKGCQAHADCVSGNCDLTAHKCSAASCTNSRKDGSETDIDCGGSACVSQGKKCALTQGCGAGTDCTSGICDATSHTCVSCSDGAKNGAETALDCGGSACVAEGKKCGLTQACGSGTDCTSGICDPTSLTCVSCSDGAKNGAETATDCGGSACVAEGKTCGLTQACSAGSDCASGICDATSHTCVSCSDGAKNGTETGTDCGGTTCVAAGKKCGEGQGCGATSDCSGDLYCASQLCSAPASWSVASASTFSASTVSDAVAVSANDIWAAGDDVLAHFTGSSWSSEQPLGADNDILGLFARSDGFGGSEVFVGGSDNIMQHWNGSSWFSVQISFTGAAQIQALHGTSSLLLAVGSEGQVARYDALQEQFTSEFGGGGGGPGGLPGMPPPTSEDLFAVFVLDDNHAWAAGANGTIIELNTGAWSKKTTPSTATLRWLWASADDDVWAVGDGGVILHYDGASWTTISSGTTNDLACVWGDGAGSVWAVGASGTIRYDFGDGFLAENSGTSSDLGVVFGFDTTRWAMGASTVLVERD